MLESKGHNIYQKLGKKNFFTLKPQILTDKKEITKNPDLGLSRFSIKNLQKEENNLHFCFGYQKLSKSKSNVLDMAPHPDPFFSSADLESGSASTLNQS